MDIVVKLIVLIGACAVGTLMIVYRELWVRTFGHNDLAEKYLGAGGSYKFWQILGILLIVGAVIYIVN